MAFWSRVVGFVRAFVGQRRIEAELEDEIAHHVELETQANIRRGLPPVEARRRALTALGGVTQTRDAVRDVRRLMLTGVWNDVRYAARQLRHSPVFALTAVIVLGVGIGVSTAVFSIANAIFFAAPPVAAPTRLVYMYQQVDGHLAIGDSRDLTFFQAHPEAFANVTSHARRTLSLAVDGDTAMANGEAVSASYFDVLGVPAALGRTFDAGEDLESTTEPALVISDDLWRRRFQSSASIIGQTVTLDSKRVVIVGVTPPGFRGLSDPWTPSEFWITQTQLQPLRGSGTPAGLIGRLRSGQTLDAAQAVINTLGETMLRERAAEFPRAEITIRPFALRPIGDVRTPFEPDGNVVPAQLLVAVTAVATIVLLIATTNIAGLLMARGIARTSELAIRRGLGAGAWRLVRQLAIEGLMLSLAGGTAGAGVAVLLTALYRDYAPAQYIVPVGVDLHVLGFALGVAVVTGLAVGITPAKQALHIDVASSLGAGSIATSGSRSRLRRWILIPQVSLAFVLLIAAGVYGRELAHAELADLGYGIRDVAVLWIRIITPPSPSLRADSPEFQAKVADQLTRSRQLYETLLQQVRSISGLSGVALSAIGSPAFGAAVSPERLLTRDDFLAGRRPQPGPPSTFPVSPGYFHTMEIPLVAGRDFDDHDTPSSAHVAVLSAGLAARLWPNELPVGKQLAMYAPGHLPKDYDWLDVVGVAGDVRAVLQDADTPQIWTPMSQQWHGGFLTVVARTPGEPSAQMTRQLRTAVMSTDSQLSIMQATTMQEIVGGVLFERRAAAAILAVSGGFGLLLASIGLYGMIAYSVEQRQKEIGIRAALGADSRDLLMLIIRQGAIVTALGLAVGTAVGLVGLKLAMRVTGLSAHVDAITVGAVVTVVLLVIAVACYLPARRASKVDPMVVLRGL